MMNNSSSPRMAKAQEQEPGSSPHFGPQSEITKSFFISVFLSHTQQNKTLSKGGHIVLNDGGPESFFCFWVLAASIAMPMMVVPVRRRMGTDQRGPPREPSIEATPIQIAPQSI